MKRTLPNPLWHLIGGVALTIGIAWAAALANVIPTGATKHDAPWPMLPPQVFAIGQAHVSRADGFGISTWQGLLLYNGSLEEVGTIAWCKGACAGLPFRALARREIDYSPRGTGTALQRQITQQSNDACRAGIPVAGSFARLPIIPLWFGLAGDVLVWGGAMWIVHASLRGMRRRRRLRGGLCVTCGHRLVGGASCQECGAPAAEAMS